jgi:hypothetical protein
MYQLRYTQVFRKRLRTWSECVDYFRDVRGERAQHRVRRAGVQVFLDPLSTHIVGTGGAQLVDRLVSHQSHRGFDAAGAGRPATLGVVNLLDCFLIDPLALATWGR